MTLIHASTQAVGTRRWWETAVGYEVYLRSFADGNGDGIGDFIGLTSRLDHLVDLGVDAVWVTPFYPSPQRDFGYDVADYCDVAPEYGTLADFDAFTTRAHNLGLRVVIDLVPNHCSSDHPWFLEALADPSSEKRDWFIWKDPAPDGGPPNNWRAIFGGPAWEYEEVSGQFWMHLFLAEQPDLNWEHPGVRAAFRDILRFWLERGVDGFRVDVSHSLVKDQSFADNPLKPGIDVPLEFGDFAAHLDIDQDGVFAVYEEWAPILAEYDAFMIGETWVETERLWEYSREGRLHYSFWFGLMELPWDPVVFAAEVRHAISTVPQGHGWVTGSHDAHRAVTRFGGGEEGVERVLALWVAMMGLPGVPFLYQGEELGLENGHVAPEDVVDPVGRRTPEDGRDPCRTPMPWEPGTPQAGFTTAEDAWLRSSPRSDAETASVQWMTPGSALDRTRTLLRVRRDRGDRRRGPVDWQPAPEGTLVYRRGDVVHAANLLDEGVRVAVPEGGWTLRHTTNGGRLLDDGILLLPARSGAILERSR
jgi:alpha-glucosidase